MAVVDLFVHESIYDEVVVGVLEGVKVHIADERFRTRSLRIRNLQTLTEILRERVITQPRAYWFSVLTQADVPHAAIRRVDEATLNALHTPGTV